MLKRLLGTKEVNKDDKVEAAEATTEKTLEQPLQDIKVATELQNKQINDIGQYYLDLNPNKSTFHSNQKIAQEMVNYKPAHKTAEQRWEYLADVYASLSRDGTLKNILTKAFTTFFPELTEEELNRHTNNEKNLLVRATISKYFKEHYFTLLQRNMSDIKQLVTEHNKYNKKAEKEEKPQAPEAAPQPVDEESNKYQELEKGPLEILSKHVISLGDSYTKKVENPSLFSSHSQQHKDLAKGLTEFEVKSRNFEDPWQKLYEVYSQLGTVKGLLATGIEDRFLKAFKDVDADKFHKMPYGERSLFVHATIEKFFSENYRNAYTFGLGKKRTIAVTVGGQGLLSNNKNPGPAQVNEAHKTPSPKKH